MQARIRLAPSSTALMAAPPLCSTELTALPAQGAPYCDDTGRYTVVRVLEDVDPDYGQTIAGPVVYVVKVSATAARMLGAAIVS